jgi:4-diphosphocytidyl-2-C-methyl-D-erythritol kinase
MELLLALPAPAKLNLFLHVIGRRADGYHELQTVFQLIDLADWLDFERRADGAIVREGDLLGAADDDLAVRAARALQSASETKLGATIGVTKHIPAGSGLGGGSSDAATTLIALNRVWRLGYDRGQLAAIGAALGADVPFFLHGRNAFGEGIGDRLTTVATPPAWYAVVWPQVHVSTLEIFSDPGLTANTKATKISGFSAAGADRRRELCGAGELYGSNDLEPIARRRAPEIDAVLQHLGAHGAARMTGSGSAVFLATGSERAARSAVSGLPPKWKSWVVRGLDEHPLAVW